MTPTRTQLEKFDPNPLTEMAHGLRNLASDTESLFTRYELAVSKVAGVSWIGKTADAVQDRAAEDKRVAIV